jgi:hypothetical protein
VRTATVLAAFPTSLYLRLDRHEDVVAVLTRDAVDLPVGVRLAVSADELDQAGGWAAHPGNLVFVGAGKVALPAAEVVVTRTRAAAIHRLPVDRTEPLRRPDTTAPSTGQNRAVDRTEPLRRPDTNVQSTGQNRAVDRAPAPNNALLTTSTELARRALAGQEVNAAVAGMVGAGQGLTPSGDDALCGILLTLRALGRLDAHAAVALAVRGRLGATTSISAALLCAAADGWAAPPVIRLLTRITAASPAGSHTILDTQDRDVLTILAIGHTSGADLLTGVTATLAEAAATATATATATEVFHPHNRQGAPRG